MTSSDPHVRKAMEMYGVPESEVTLHMRRAAKNANFVEAYCDGRIEYYGQKPRHEVMAKARRRREAILVLWLVLVTVVLIALSVATFVLYSSPAVAKDRQWYLRNADWDERVDDGDPERYGR